jgi:cation:H+ antiporter
MIDFVLLLVGVGLLTLGGEALIRGALAAARRLNVSPLLSGLVIVGFGTSSPELVVSVDAALSGSPDIAVGNVVGSNIANILLILGLSATITVLRVTPLSLRRDAVMVIVATLIFMVLALGGGLGRLDAAIFLLVLLGYLTWAYQTEKNSASPSAELHQAEADEVQSVPQTVWWTISAIVLGLLLLIGGSQVLLNGAIGIAQRFGVSEALIGLTLVAVGTSLPELTVSVMAALRKHADVAVGNVLGSNIFNLLAILGISALVEPLPLAQRIQSFDQWAMLGAAVLLVLFLLKKQQLTRLAGITFLLAYVAYVWVSFVVYA